MKRSTKVALAAAGIGLLLVFAGLTAFGAYWFQRDRNQNAALHKAGNALSQNDFKTAIFRNRFDSTHKESMRIGVAVAPTNAKRIGTRP